MNAAHAPDEGPLALTHSAWINSWTLQRACALLGVTLCVPEGTVGLPMRRWQRGEPLAWQFFTEEASLRLALQGQAAGQGRYLPQHFPMALLDDKWAFADYLAADPEGPAGLAQWPLDAAGQACFPLIVKGRHSWRGNIRLPRGWVCHTAAELPARLQQLDAEGQGRDNYFLQEWLGEQPHRLLSVGGFFDAEDETRNLALVTDRVARYEAGPSSSAMLVTVADDWGLVPAAFRVLRRLRFRGPFEMEFLQAGSRRVVVELNPRFWMQHGLFLPLGNALVKRYLGRDTAADRQPLPTPRLAWVDGAWLLRGLLRLDRQVLAACWRWVVREGRRPVICPSPGYLVALKLKRLLGLSA